MDANWWQSAQWLFFLPGEAFVAQFGRAELASYLAWISAGLWLLGFCAVYYVVGFAQDAVDPTYRQQRREGRQARARSRHLARVSSNVGAASPLRVEPTFMPGDGPARPEAAGRGDSPAP